jgi:hypothetical protein
MPDAPGSSMIRVAVYFVDDHERAIAEEALGETTQPFANVIEGSCDAAGITELVEKGLVVEALPPVSVPVAADDPVRASAVARLEAHTAETGLASDLPTGDFYRIHLRGPITREQRLELEALGVDIAAFEPPGCYRTFLTPEQHDQVEDLDYVAELVPYSVGDKLTPELAELVDEHAYGATTLAGDGTEPGPTTLFDCLVHREADLAHIRDLIAGTENVEVVGTSNLRVRFAAPLDLPLLAALVARPEVRQLTVFRPPTLVGGGPPR